MAGIIYVASNIAIPNMVKIGKCGIDQLKARMRNLSGTNVPFPFECSYAFVVDDETYVEEWLHEIYQDSRVNKAREFFRVTPDAVAKALIPFNPQEIGIDDDYALGDLDRKETLKAETQQLEKEHIDCIIAAVNEDLHPNAIEEVFFGGNCWRSLSIAEAKRKVIKWFALYKTKPERQVTHYAKILEIVPVPDVEGKWQINFDGKPIAIEHPIDHGDSAAPLIQGPRYCNKSDLLSAGSLTELFSS
ncbi:MAG: GIY-YIG nuclease family protein [Methyloligellaceae bacterium]